MKINDKIKRNDVHGATATKATEISSPSESKMSFDDPKNRQYHQQLEELGSDLRGYDPKILGNYRQKLNYMLVNHSKVI
jgi:hypothetical protein